MEILGVVGRIRAAIARASYFYIVLILTVIGLTSIVIGFIGLGLYISTVRNYAAYIKTVCLILNHEYDNCQRGNYISPTTCYSVMWAVEYATSNSVLDHYMFSTITEIHDKSTEALEQLSSYPDHTNHTCYYYGINTANVQWRPPQSPTPFLIMIVIGFSFAVVYFIVIGIMAIYRCRKRKK